MRPDLANIHPLPKLNREWTQVAAAGNGRHQREYDKAEFIPVQVQRASMDARDFAVMKNSHYAITVTAGVQALQICLRGSTRSRLGRNRTVINRRK